MKINPKLKFENNIFYNTLCLIMAIFAMIYFFTSFKLNNEVITKTQYTNLTEGSIYYGPIIVKKNQCKIYRINVLFYGKNTNTYISGEVLDKNRDTLYEFGKDLWHEDGYDSEGYWSEADRKMTADLTFSEAGKYYIQFNTDKNSIYNIQIEIQAKKGSGIPHLMMGTILLIILLFVFYLNNKPWLKEKTETADEWLEGFF